MLLSNLNLLATAPGGVARLRELILTLAVQGKLVPQDTADEPASVLLQKIRAEKDRLIAEGKIKKDKPLAAIAEEEKPFEVPKKWAWIRLGSTMEMLNGRAFKPSEWIDGGLPIVRIQNLNNPNASFNYCDPSSVAEKNLIDDGEFLISWSGTPGTSFGAFIWSRGPAALNQHIFKCVLIGDAFLPEFLRLSINSQLNVLIAQAQGGVGLQHITKGVLENLVLVLPSLAEQSRIVARVEELMRLCDALEAKGQLEATQHAQLLSTLLGTLTASATPEELANNWQRVAQHFDLLLDRPQAIDALEQTLLQLAVRGLLAPQDPADEPASVLLQKIRAEKDRLIAEGKIKRDKPLPLVTDEEKPFELPVGWEWVRFGDVVELLNGYAFKSEWFKSAGVRLLRNVNISHGHVDWSAPVMLDAAAAQSYEQFALRVGDIVLSLDRPIISTGLKYAVIRESDLPCLLLQRVARLTVSACLSPEFLQLWLQSDLFVGTIDPGRSNGVPHISTKQVAGLAFALPPLAEQSRIVTRVTQLRRLCFELRQRLAEREAVQARLAEALVQQVA